MVVGMRNAYMLIKSFINDKEENKQSELMEKHKNNLRKKLNIIKKSKGEYFLSPKKKFQYDRSKYKKRYQIYCLR